MANKIKEQKKTLQSITGPTTTFLRGKTQKKTTATMVKENVAIALIIIILFIVLALVGFGIYALQNHAVFFWRRRQGDEEEGEE